MLYQLYANDSRFKAIQFKKGINIILSDRTDQSGKKDSRNGLGKTLLMQIIHFCLGSDLQKKLLPVDNIQEWIFYLELDVCNQRVKIARSIRDNNIIKIEGECKDFPILPEENKREGFKYYRIPEWRNLLGISLFGLEVQQEKYTPSFRVLVSYFIRNGIEGYINPFIYFKNQPNWSMQVHNAFLLGIAWHHISKFQEIKEEENIINIQSKSKKDNTIISKGELEAEKVRLQHEIEREQKELSKFKVHDQYKALQEEADEYTRIIHAAVNKKAMLEQYLESSMASVKYEKPPADTELDYLYGQLEIHFSQNVKKTLLEARIFHEKAVRYREEFLRAETVLLRNKIEDEALKIKQADEKRSAIMTILKDHGALEDFTLLQDRWLEKKRKLSEILEQIKEVHELSIRRKEVKSKKMELEAMMQRDYEQSRDSRENAIIGFNENSEALYHESGRLIIDLKENGYSFDVDIPRSNSNGVNKMKIFCYDLTLVEIFAKSKKIDFLIHDSTIFEGVDSRQVAHAIEHAYKISEQNNFQYICALNSDMIPHKDFSSDFNIENHTCLKLSDKHPENSLFGFRFHC